MMSRSGSGKTYGSSSSEDAAGKEPPNGELKPDAAIEECPQDTKALHQSYLWYRQLAESSVDFIYVIGRDFRVIYVNKSGAGALRMRPEDAAGKHLKDLFPPDTAETMINSLAQVFASGKALSKEMKHHFYGGDFHIHISLNPIFDDDGKVSSVMGVSRDINDLKSAEEAISNSEEKFRALSESTPAATCILQDGKIIYANPAMEKVSGYGRDELLSINFLDMVHPAARKYIEGRYNDWLSGRDGEFRSSFMGLRKDGRVCWIDLSRKTIDYQGRPALLLTGIDITERVKAEEALRESEERFRLFAETIPAVVLIYQDDRFIYINKAAEHVTGYTREELYRMKPWDIMHPDHQMYIMERVQARERGETLPSFYEVKLVTKAGKEIWVGQSSATITYDHKPAGIVVAFDLTERKQTEAELLSAKQQAELYLDLMGHDINNMHQVALGYLELAHEMYPDVGQKDLLEKPIAVLQRSARLIRNVQKLQKHRHGAFRVEKMDLQAVLLSVQQDYGGVPGKNVTLSMNGREHCFVQANELLPDVFANLVGNAIRHTNKKAEITINIDLVNDDGPYYRVIVEDDGPGIPDGSKGKIFNRMQKSSARGMGLGLYLVKTLVDSYSGKVWVEDRVMGDHTKGARFVVMLPAIPE